MNLFFTSIDRCFTLHNERRQQHVNPSSVSWNKPIAAEESAYANFLSTGGTKPTFPLGRSQNIYNVSDAAQQLSFVQAVDRAMVLL